ncbi:hypothetical protein ICG_05817 [Bacillus cereus BAG1X1-3]|nr:hypothetical protein ICG_05817 [Bacillus cereus BAG1X1-3]EOO73880.1 hypothetical protein IC7_05762 [Bacillus cereus BAG1O-1]SEB21411.1 hypothetical protein SAMN04488146_12412 [Bacillus nitratireducens]
MDEQLGSPYQKKKIVLSDTKLKCFAYLPLH